MPQHTDPGKKRTYKPVRPLTSETLLRVLVGISQGDINDPHQANKSVERTIQIMVAYAAVAGLTLFFLTIPSFINDSGGLDTAGFVSFVWIGSPFFDCLVLLASILFLGQSKNVAVAVCLAFLSGFEAYVYAGYTDLTDVAMLILSVMVGFHAVQIVALLLLIADGPKKP